MFDPLQVFHIFCDESHTSGQPIRVQGGIWVPLEGMRAVRHEFRELRKRHPTLTEFKWSYVTGKKPLAAYYELLDLFFSSAASQYLAFKCIVVRDLDDASRKMGTVERDVGFYKTYYTFLYWRLVRGSHNFLHIDKRSSPRVDPENDLQQCLNRGAARDWDNPFHVLSCKTVCSKGEDLLQLADVLCGALGWAKNGKQSVCGAKPLLHERICQKMGWKDLATQTTGASERKFNIWDYKPKKQTGAPTA